ncbi:cation/calcium exchanger 4-like [Gossypium australe]|uniref:Cation/calcium exchanger 4-like n=1 Tax=Gossypium australe TaxID=47621 RepID=A0A5B6WN89_9ROSI|nr:cation/calcium exchanger 4-like [Gossypium australe]
MAPEDTYVPLPVWGASSEQSDADGHYLRCKSVHSLTGSLAFRKIYLGLCSAGMLIPRVLSSNKAIYENNGRLLPSTAVLGIILNVVSCISEPQTMGNCTGNWAIVHRTYVPYDDSDSFWGWQTFEVSPLVCLRGRVLSYARARSMNMDPNPLHEIPPSFEDIFGDNLEPQHTTRSGSSSYHPEFHLEARTPTTEDIFPSAPPVTQYHLTLNYSAYDYSTFLSTPTSIFHPLSHPSPSSPPSLCKPSSPNLILSLSPTIPPPTPILSFSSSRKSLSLLLWPSDLVSLMGMIILVLFVEKISELNANSSNLADKNAQENDLSVSSSNPALCYGLFDHKGFANPCEFLKAHPQCSSDGFFDYIKFFYCGCEGFRIVGYVVLGVWLAALFYLLGNTVANYFCCSLEKLSHLLRLPLTIVGVSLFPLGNGAPDVFANIAAFLGTNTGEVGLNNVLGGAILLVVLL